VPPSNPPTEEQLNIIRTIGTHRAAAIENLPKLIASAR
jgi:hypothetical protein